MKKIILIGAGLGVILGLAAVIYVFRPPAEASVPIEAIPIALQPSATVELPTPPADLPSTPTASGEVEALASDENEASGQRTYTILQAESEVRFSIDEILRGSPFTAVGKTNQVAGEIFVDFDQASAQSGVIQVNARTLTTDSAFRDRAIENQILQTGEYEYISFAPTAITGLPTTGQAGEPIPFQITGDLTIRDVSHPVTFDVEVTFISIERMEGYAQATVLRSDYGLVIPSVPSVADVSDEVFLEIEFVAVSG